MIFGSTPAVAYDRMRASGCTPSAFARSAVETTTAAAPSLMPEALPAVTDPSLANAGFSAASFSAVLSGARMLVGVDDDRALLLLHFDRHDLRLEAALGDRRGRAALALSGVCDPAPRA